MAFAMIGWCPCFGYKSISAILLNILSQATAASSYCNGCKDPAENLIKINVFFGTLNQHIVEDKIDYAIGDGSLINALGGCLSLWLGISFCNLFEILELILDLLGNLIDQMFSRLIGTNVK